MPSQLLRGWESVLPHDFAAVTAAVRAVVAPGLEIFFLCCLGTPFSFAFSAFVFSCQTP